MGLMVMTDFFCLLFLGVTLSSSTSMLFALFGSLLNELALNLLIEPDSDWACVISYSV